ncbi:MAG: hypothetical protein KKE50_04565 [Nanoarchaeota archaeon]|nr:hypothetical protein [Nanoarchaeota archaeon]
MNRSKKEARIESRVMLIGIAGLILVFITSLVFIVSALTSDDKTALQNELNNLTLKLSSQGYDWLADYSMLKLINTDNLMLSNDNKMLT